VTPYEPAVRVGRPSSFARWWPAFAVLVGLGLIAYLGFGAQGGCPDSSGLDAVGPCPTPQATSPVVGVVTVVDSTGLGQVDQFVLRLPDASTMTLAMGPLENATEFSPSHLAEHQVTSEPIRVFFRMENGVPIVYRIEDASP
jgi:hypothetical protein